MSLTLPSPSDCCSPCSGLSVTVDTTGAGTFTWPLIANIYTTITQGITPTLGVTQDAYVTGDGNGGVWRWDAVSTLADDGATVIKPNDVDVSAPGRWRKII